MSQKEKNAKQKALELTLGKLEKAYGQGVVMKLGDRIVENIPSIDSRHLRLMYKIAAPNVDLSQHFECENCDHEQEMEVPLNADFFWPDR